MERWSPPVELAKRRRRADHAVNEGRSAMSPERLAIYLDKI